MGKAVFITATGTDLGKTAFSLALMLWARKKGIDAMYYKPVQCGFVSLPGEKEAGDSQWVERMSPLPLSTKVGMHLRAPVSPHLSAERESRVLELEYFLREIKGHRGKCELLVVEGAGGVAVPINRRKDFLVDLAAKGDFPCLLVSSLEIGTLSHTLSSLAFLRERRVELSGIAFSQRGLERPDPGDDNIRTLIDFSGIPLIGELPYHPSLADATGIPKEGITAWLTPMESGFEKWWSSCPT